MMVRHTVAVELEAVFSVVAGQQQLNTDLSVYSLWQLRALCNLTVDVNRFKLVLVGRQ